MSGGPAALVGNVALQQQSEALHCGVTARGRDPVRRADHDLTVRGRRHTSASKVVAPFGVDDSAGNVAAVVDRVLHIVDSELRGPPIRDRLAYDTFE